LPVSYFKVTNRVVHKICWSAFLIFGYGKYLYLIGRKIKQKVR
jgi:hypothetical protein